MSNDTQTNTTKSLIPTTVPGIDGTTEVTLVKDEATGEYATEFVDGVRFVRKDFEGLFKGLSYFTKEYNDLNKAVEDFNNADKSTPNNGEKIILSLINDGLLFGTRNKVKMSKIPKLEDPKANALQLEKLAETMPIQFSIKDANEYVPGTRELTAAGYMNLSKKRLAEARAEGVSADRAKELRAEARALMVKAQEAMEREDELAAVAEAAASEAVA